MKRFLSLMICICLLMGICVNFTGCSSSKFENLDGTWEFVSGENQVGGYVITIDSQNSTVSYKTKDGVEKVNTYGEIKYSSNPIVPGYSQICFNPEATFGNKYVKTNSFEFIPFGETVMWCDTPSSASSTLPGNGFIRKCTVNPEEATTATTYDFMLDGIVDKETLEVNLDAILGEYTYKYTYVDDQISETASFAKTTDGYTYTDGDAVYNISDIVYYAGYGAIKMNCEGGSGYSDIVLYIYESADDHLSVSYEGYHGKGVGETGYKYMQKKA